MYTTNKQLETEIFKTVISNSIKNIKYIGIYLMKDVRKTPIIFKSCWEK